MKLVKQVLANECGICVLNMMINHLHKKEGISEIIAKANLSANGLSLFELERLAE